MSSKGGGLKSLSPISGEQELVITISGQERAIIQTGEAFESLELETEDFAMK